MKVTNHVYAQGLALAALVALVGGLAGCGGGGGGGDGNDGITVATGTSTTTTGGTSTTTTTTFSAGSPAPQNTSLSSASNLPGINLGGTTFTVGGDGGDGVFAVGDSPTVTFSLDTINKAIVPGSGMQEKSSIAIEDLTYAEIYLSGPTTNYQRVISNPGNFITASVRNADGTYTYTLPAIPATYLAPPNDSASFGTTDGELQGQALTAGTYTIGIAAYKNYTVGTATVKDVVNYTKNIQFNTGAAEVAREVVKDDNCNRCHATLQVHGGMRRKVALCVLCHVSGSEDKNLTTVDVDGDGDMDADDQTVGASIDFRVMVHKIHNGAHLPSVKGVGVTALGAKDYTVTAEPYDLVGYGNALHEYSEVAFPVWPSLTTAMPRDLGYSALTSAAKTLEGSILTGVVACDKCHGDPDGTGSMTAPSNASLARIPSRRACGACHDDIDWTLPYQSNGLTMAANQADAGCAACHPSSNALAFSATNLPVVEAHKHPWVNSTINPGANLVITEVRKNSAAGADLTTTAAANGDAIWVEFTCTNDAGTALGIGDMSTVSLTCVGPTTNPQPIFPVASVTGTTVSPYDYAGRMVAASTSGRPTMSRVVAGSIGVSETLTVEFTSTTAFTVTGSTSGALGGTAFAAATSTNPASSSISSVELTTAAVAQNITVAFTSATAFTVTGTVSGAMGSGTLPSTDGKSATTRFTSTDGTVSFVITSGTTAFAAGNNIYLTVFKGAAGNPVIFAFVVGRSALAATNRYYYEVVKTAADYSLLIPMDITLEYLGDGNGAAGQVLTAGNLPVYYGRQSLYEATAVTARTTLAAGSLVNARFVSVAATTNWAIDDYAVIEPLGAVGVREYAQVKYVDTTNLRLWFGTPLRYAHANLSAIDEVTTLTLLQEGAAAAKYTLNATLGTVTSLGAGFGNTFGIIMSYRTDGKIGWKRHNADAAQTTFTPPPCDSPDLAQAWGEWTGLAYQDGTYTVYIWAAKYIDYGLQNEVQTYRGTGPASKFDILYGTATSLTEHSFISSDANCDRCHDYVLMHGGGRRGLTACLPCHSVAGTEDMPAYGMTAAQWASTKATTRATVEFRQMLHKIHMGEELTNASTWAIIGHQGSVNQYAEVVFPAMPGMAKHCDVCHGTGSTTWLQPTSRVHAAQTVPTRNWFIVCSSCHDSTDVEAHAKINTALYAEAAATTGTIVETAGTEACGACHGPGGTYSVEVMHKNR